MTTTFFFSAYSCDEDFDEEVAGVDEMNGKKACTSMEMLERKRATHAAELFMMVMDGIMLLYNNTVVMDVPVPTPSKLLMAMLRKNYEQCYSSPSQIHPFNCKDPSFCMSLPSCYCIPAGWLAAAGRGVLPEREKK